MSESLQPHGLRHTLLPCPSLSPGVFSNSCPLSQWCHPTISFSVAPFSSCPQSLSGGIETNSGWLLEVFGLNSSWWKWVIGVSASMIKSVPGFLGERQSGFCLFLLFWEFRSQLIRNISASSTQLCNMFAEFVCIWWFFPYFFRKTNAEKRLRNNLGIHVNIRSVETHPKVGPFSGRNVFVSNLQRAGEALTQSFGGGSRLYIYPRGSWSQLHGMSLLRILVIW